MSQPLLLADAPGMLYRAFYGLPDSITGVDDHPVNALLGATNALLQCVEKYSPRAIVSCFGQESATYRTDAFPAYHATRPAMPDALAWQWERAPGFWQALGWMVVDTPDLEADDLLGSLAAAEVGAGGSALILTGDRDMFQCASDRVTILMQGAGKGAPGEIGPDGVRERYGIEPEQVPDFIALRGDPSDGIPGAKGIGEKTAAELLRRHGDLESAIAAAVREKPSVRAALIGQADELRMFRDLATLRKLDLKPPPDLPTDFAQGSEAAAALGMRRLSDRLAGSPSG